MSAPVPLDRKLVVDIGDKFNVGPEPDLFGIEVELEGKKLASNSVNVLQYWTRHADGSLRMHKPGDEAVEYILHHPLNLDQTIKSLDILFKYLNSPGVEIYDSYRTSIHVHLNFLNDTVRTTVNFITLAIIFDELFVSQNGETRAGNNFCLRSRDAEGQIADMCESVRENGSLYWIQKDNRYSSINVASLLKFGTIEFRSLECTTDFNRVSHWVKTLQALKVAARTYENPREIISDFSKQSAMNFMLRVLGPQYLKYSQVLGASTMLSNGMRLAQDFAFCSDWKLMKDSDVPAAKPAKSKTLNLNGLQWVNDLNQDQFAQPIPQPAEPQQNPWVNFIPGQFQ